MKENFKHFKTFFAFILVTLVMLFYGSYYYETNATIDDPDYLEVQKNPVISNIVVTFDYHPVVPDVIQSLDTITLQANPGPANNGGSSGWAMFFDLIAGSNNVAVTQMSTANSGTASTSFSVEIFTRSGTALGGPVGSGPGSSTVGWTSLGTVPAVQGSTNSGISLLFTIPTIQVSAFDTVGVAVRVTGVGPRYFGTGSPPYEFYSDSNITIKTGDGRSAPFTPTGSWFASRALTGVIRYVVAAPPVPRVWSEQTSPVTTALYSISAVDDNIAWACGAGGKVIRTTNSGLAWTNVSGNLPTSYNFYAIYAWDANIALATASPTAGDYVYRTSNGGANWTEVFNLAGGFGNGLWMTDANTAYHVGDPVGGNWMLQKSTNGGVNWSTWATVPSTAAGWNNAFMIVGNNVWMGTNANYLMYSSNLGVNWSQQTTTFTNQYAVWFNNANVGLCAFNTLNVTTNSGANWTALTSPLAGNAGGICGSGNEWFVAQQSTNIYYSANNGANWSTSYTAPDGAFYHITQSRAGNTVWGVRSNGKISRYGIPLTGVTPITGTVPENYSLSQNYPNPFNPTTKINFAIPKQGLVTLKVYDVLGREVANLVNEVRTAGNYIVDFDASNLSSGIYLYRIETNGFVDTKKMTLLK